MPIASSRNSGNNIANSIDRFPRLSRMIFTPQIVQKIGPPARRLSGRDDRILINDRASNIEQIAPLYYDGQLVRINLLCRG